jgi:exopolyphosphatase
VTTVLLLFPVLSVPLLLIWGSILYLDPSPQPMRLCLPVSLHRISIAAHKAVSCRPLPAYLANGIHSTSTTSLGKGAMSTSTSANMSDGTKTVYDKVEVEAGKVNGNGEDLPQSGRLADWLMSQRALFLGDAQKGRLEGWTVAMGNEAGGE